MNKSTTTSTRPTHQFTLDNGLRVIVREDHRTAEIYSTLLMKVGARYELPDERDLSFIVMNAMADDFDPGLVGEMGGESRVYTEEDTSCFELKMPREQLETTFSLQSAAMKVMPSDTVFRFHWDAQVTLRKEVLPTDFPWNFTTPQLEELIETGTGYYKPAQGIISSLERLNLEKIRHWRNTWYGPENAVLSIAGAVTPDEVKSLAEEYFGGISRCNAPDRPFIKGPEEPGYRQITQNLDIERPMLVVTFNVPSMVTTTEPQSVRALQVMSSAPIDPDFMGEHLSPPASYMPRFTRGNTRLKLAFNYEGGPDEAEADFWALIDQLKSTPLSKYQVEVAIKKVAEEQDRINDSIDGQSVIIALLVANGLAWQLVDLEVMQLESVTPEDIQKAAKTYLTRERATVGYLLPLEG